VPFCCTGVVLRVRVDGPDDVAARLTALGDGALVVTTADDVALVLAVGADRAGADRAGADRAGADVVLADDRELGPRLAALVADRLLPWSVALAAGRFAPGPAVLVDPDPGWPASAARRLARVRAALTPLTGGSTAGWSFDHIGSTAVPGLPAKAFLDLQVRAPVLPEAGALDAALSRVGFLATAGSRPDSPGVHRDVPLGSAVVPDDVWRKRLFVSPDPATPAVLHVRLAASPWGRSTVQFRDWLRAHPAERDHYAQLKSALAAAHEQDADPDDYTRAKSTWITEVLPRAAAWSDGRNGW
jgi:GrpB-like predicted nucleotidyltransferase (UPF0157 family)